MAKAFHASRACVAAATFRGGVDRAFAGRCRGLPASFKNTGSINDHQDV
jgi:hypothetical protein